MSDELQLGDLSTAAAIHSSINRQYYGKKNNYFYTTIF